MKARIYTAIELILGILKSLIINFKYLPIKQAVHLPILVSCNCKLQTLHGKLIIDAPVRPGMILFGVGPYGLFDHVHEKTLVNITSGGVLKFKGKARFGPGTRLSVNNQLTFGDNFAVTGSSKIVCSESITFGDNCLLSWDVLFLDKDWHTVIYDGKEGSMTKPILIGNHVWFGTRTTVLKGTVIQNDCVIAAGSVVNAVFESDNVLIGGTPAKVIRNDVNWSK